MDDKITARHTRQISNLRQRVVVLEQELLAALTALARMIAEKKAVK
jgi:hypothetical protein